MSGDDRKGPRWNRPGSIDRDVYTPKTPPAGTPLFVDEECTGKYDGPELEQRRSRRPTPERIARLEKRQDESDKRQGEFAVAVGRMEGKLDTAVDFIKLSQTEAGKTARTRITVSGKTLATIVGALITAISAYLVARYS